MSNEKVEFAKLVDASVTMGANLTLAMGGKKLALALDLTTTLVPNELILDIGEGAVELRLLARFRYL